MSFGRRLQSTIAFLRGHADGSSAGPAGTASRLLALAIVVMMTLRLVGPILADPTSWGWNDWDSHAAYRYIVPLSIKRYFEFPGWNPYFCGGYPAWAYVEGATNLVSPYFPFYLVLPLGIALRIEIVGSMLAGAAFTYLFASRFTPSIAFRMVAVVFYALNGRWALQMSEGHTWFLQYSWLPLTLYFFDRAVAEKRRDLTLAAGAAMAMQVYMGGIYPLPHTALIVGLFGVALAVQLRTVVPIENVAIVGLTSVGLSAPKLFPIFELMHRYPRTIDSPEFIDFRQLLYMMTAQYQTFFTYPVAVPAWEWHEWGIYVGWIGVVAMIVAVLCAKTGRENVVRFLGITLLVVGLGAFHPLAPWTLMHKVPPFSSQHVPSRYHYPAFLLLSVTFAAIATRWARKHFRDFSVLDPLLLVGLFAIGWDVTMVGRQSMSTSFFLHAPSHVERATEFKHLNYSRYAYSPVPRHGSVLLPMLANEGNFACYGIPDLKSVGASASRPMAYLASGTADVKVVSWSPSSAVVDVQGAPPNSLLVYNMNWDPGWLANGRTAIDHDGAPAVPVQGSQRVTFRYRPPFLGTGLLVGLVTCVLVFLAIREERRARARVGQSA